MGWDWMARGWDGLGWVGKNEGRRKKEDRSKKEEKKIRTQKKERERRKKNEAGKEGSQQSKAQYYTLHLPIARPRRKLQVLLGKDG